jgi:uracil-DNA glycosylase
VSRSGEGNPSARIMIVGECWSDRDEAAGRGFSGTSGQELNRMLQEVGITHSECYFTNLVNARPPRGDIEAWITTKKKDIQANMTRFRDRWVAPQILDGFYQLLKEIHLVKPNIILALGSSALWALTGTWGITKWRGSQLRVTADRSLYPQGLLSPEDQPFAGKLIPTLHPSFILRDFSQRPIVINDLKRVLKERDQPEYQNEPAWKFLVRPSIDSALVCLQGLLAKLEAAETEIWIDFDLETRAGHIACAGLSWSAFEAASIPLMSRSDNNGYWLEEEEVQVVWLLYLILTHKKAAIRGQHLLFDAQYTYRYWHFVPRVRQDTMIAHHSVFCGLPKKLDFLASLYCDYYVQWKPDKTAWKEGG